MCVSLRILLDRGALQLLLACQIGCGHFALHLLQLQLERLHFICTLFVLCRKRLAITYEHVKMSSHQTIQSRQDKTRLRITCLFLTIVLKSQFFDLVFNQ